MKSHTIRAWFPTGDAKKIFAFGVDSSIGGPSEWLMCRMDGTKTKTLLKDREYRITITRVRREKGRKK